jgi:hypothetical protein
MKTPRRVHLVGSVPLTPAAAVFEKVAQSLGQLINRIPDGEQVGWLLSAFGSFRHHPDLEVSRQVPLNAHGADPIDFFRLRPGMRPEDLVLGPFAFAENAINSYRSFRELRDKGVILPGTRYLATLPGPGTTAFTIELAAEHLLPASRAALLREIERMLQHIPAEDLAIQLDVAMEAEHEEWLRRPDDFDQPVHTAFHWSLEQMADSAAWLANRIPVEVELGFHICSVWHHNPEAGQDNRTLVDIANAVLSRVTRPVAYLHVPIIPEHRQEDYEPLADLKLPEGAELFLGLINLGDGIEGARARIAMAEKIVPEFGVSFFCGLGRARSNGGQDLHIHLHPPIPALRKATTQTIDDVLELHRASAQA